MAIIRPFQAVRPSREKAPLVAALPYDVMTTEEARQMTKGNPDSFLHVDKAEIDMDPSVDPYDMAVYQKARDTLYQMLEKGVFIQDPKPYYYIYRLTWMGKSQTGLVVCTSIDEYLNGIIKKHELTREEKELDRIRHVDICNANTGPIFLAYRSQKEIDTMLEAWTKAQEPVYDFTTEDAVAHTVWVIDRQEEILRLTELFQDVKSLYIADGHHRNASAVKVGLKRRQEHPNYTGQEEFNFYLSVLFPSNQLRILDYNRAVKDLNGLSPETFLKKLEESFWAAPYHGQGPMAPKAVHEFGCYCQGQWYTLRVKEELLKGRNRVESLDVSILQDLVFGPILSIEDPRVDHRIDFIGGMRGLKELERKVDSNEMAAAFSLYPTSMNDLMEIADEGGIMPPKSTWFEPKLRSGLFVHLL